MPRYCLLSTLLARPCSSCAFSSLFVLPAGLWWGRDYPSHCLCECRISWNLVSETIRAFNIRSGSDSVCLELEFGSDYDPLDWSPGLVLERCLARSAFGIGLGSSGLVYDQGGALVRADGSRSPRGPSPIQLLSSSRVPSVMKAGQTKVASQLMVPSSPLKMLASHRYRRA